MAELCQGRILWTPVADHNGHNCYDRPVVILTPSKEIAAADELVGVVASNTAYREEPRPHTYVELPFHPSGRVCTGLKKGTVANGT